MMWNDKGLFQSISQDILGVFEEHETATLANGKNHWIEERSRVKLVNGLNSRQNQMESKEVLGAGKWKDESGFGNQLEEEIVRRIEHQIPTSHHGQNKWGVEHETQDRLGQHGRSQDSSRKGVQNGQDEARHRVLPGKALPIST